MLQFDTTTMIVGGILTGLVFGILLQRAHVARHTTIVSQFLFTDFTVLKVMLSAIVVGGIGVYAMLGMGMIEHLHVKSATLAANGLGGLIFGVGMAVLGYCPGTAVAAIGEGSRDAIYGLLGMVVGAGIYAEVYPFIQSNLLKFGDVGKITLASATNTPPWLWLGILLVIALVVFVLIERHDRKARPSL